MSEEFEKWEVNKGIEYKYNDESRVGDLYVQYTINGQVKRVQLQTLNLKNGLVIKDISIRIE